MTDKRAEIDKIVAELEQNGLEQEELKQETASQNVPIAQETVRYYNALIGAGAPPPLALACVLQWHLLMWTRAIGG